MRNLYITINDFEYVSFLYYGLHFTREKSFLGSENMLHIYEDCVTKTTILLVYKMTISSENWNDNCVTFYIEHSPLVPNFND